ncbi:MAG: sulfatase-like hydrolase/transferase [Deltaproteobacteria bacterium]|nr:sulfatase-like hydrolase/transferase [Deltaproteobacteria bacterium]
MQAHTKRFFYQWMLLAFPLVALGVAAAILRVNAYDYFARDLPPPRRFHGPQNGGRGLCRGDGSGILAGARASDPARAGEGHGPHPARARRDGVARARRRAHLRRDTVSDWAAAAHEAKKAGHDTGPLAAGFIQAAKDVANTTLLERLKRIAGGGLVLALFSVVAVYAERLLFRRSSGKARQPRSLAALGVPAAVLNALVFLSTLPPPHVASDGHPPLILISIDTLRADHLSVYGYERDTTPNLEEFARNAVVVETAIAHSAWTLPTHASMFSGVLPSQHGLHLLPIGSIRIRFCFRKCSKNAATATARSFPICCSAPATASRTDSTSTNWTKTRARKRC